MSSKPGILSLLLLFALQSHHVAAQPALEGGIGFELPCGEDNLSCPRIGNLSIIPLQCYNRSQLCDGVMFCDGSSDEGLSTTISSLECKSIV